MILKYIKKHDPNNYYCPTNNSVYVYFNRYLKLQLITQIKYKKHEFSNSRVNNIFCANTPAREEHCKPLLKSPLYLKQIDKFNPNPESYS